MHLYRFIELRILDFLDKRNGVGDKIGLSLYLLRRSLILLTGLLAHIFDWYKRLRLLRRPEPPKVVGKPFRRIAQPPKNAKLFIAAASPSPARDVIAQPIPELTFSEAPGRQRQHRLRRIFFRRHKFQAIQLKKEHA